MTSLRPALVLAVAFTIITVGAQEATAHDHDRGAVGSTSGNSYLVDVYQGAIGPGSGLPAGGSGDGIQREFVQAPFCHSGQYRYDITPVCLWGDPIVETCIDGSQALDPLWMRQRQASGAWGTWRAITWYYCPNDSALEAAILNAWTSLTPTPPEINVNPDQGWVYASVPTVFYVERSPIIHQTTLLGANVRIRATHHNYSWTWGNGTSTVTSNPGRPYPNQTLTHTYLHFEGDVVVRLTTSWNGEYSINGGNWVAISGNIFTPSTPLPLTVHNPHSHLVDCDINGNCTSGHAGPASN
ncbi:MAG: hypothetical protein CVT64_04110 [Actinobacteria bacterium HGW-Actinobacteria-4]|nr:MAG: hypothetical protein CVT64_04110 [Actinobacteria bacterium HGW-Actinobacteria-4]